MTSKPGLLFLSFSALFLIASCGDQVCISGVGKCEVPKEIRDKQTQVQTGTSGAPTAITELKSGVQMNRISVLRNQKITLVGLGGKAPYTFKMKTPIESTGNVGENDGVFVATKSIATAVVIITDDAKTSVEITIDIQ